MSLGRVLGQVAARGGRAANRAIGRGGRDKPTPALKRIPQGRGKPTTTDPLFLGAAGAGGLAGGGIWYATRPRTPQPTTPEPAAETAPARDFASELEQMYGGGPAGVSPLEAALGQLTGQYGTSRSQLEAAFAPLLEDRTAAVEAAEQARLEAALTALMQARANEDAATRGAYRQGGAAVDDILAGVRDDRSRHMGEAASALSSASAAVGESDAVYADGAAGDIAAVLANEGEAGGLAAGERTNAMADEIAALAGSMQQQQAAFHGQLSREALLGQQMMQAGSADRLAQALAAERERQDAARMQMTQQLTGLDLEQARMVFDAQQRAAETGQDIGMHHLREYGSSPAYETARRYIDEPAQVEVDVPDPLTGEPSRMVNAHDFAEAWHRTVLNLPADPNEAAASWTAFRDDVDPERLAIWEALGLPVSTREVVQNRLGSAAI